MQKKKNILKLAVYLSFNELKSYKTDFIGSRTYVGSQIFRGQRWSHMPHPLKQQ